MQLTAQIRVVRRLIPAARALQLTAHDYEQGGAKPACAWNDPVDINRVVTELVNDATTVLDTVSGLGLSDVQAEAVELLALVSGQDVEPGDTEGTWRIAQRTAPDRIVSVHDPESRHVHKTDHNYRDGFKAHVAVEPETGLVTDARLDRWQCGRWSGGTGAACPRTPRAGDPRELRVWQRSLPFPLVGGTPPCGHQADPTRAATVPGGFSIDDFAIDVASRSATCPARHTVPITDSGSAKDCGSRCDECSLRSRCTTARAGRDLKVHRHHGLLAAARRRLKPRPFSARTRSGGRWSNAASPGWCARAIDASPIAVSTATASGSAIALLRSTSAGCSTWACPGPPTGGPWPDGPVPPIHRPHSALPLPQSFTPVRKPDCSESREIPA